MSSPIGLRRMKLIAYRDFFIILSMLSSQLGLALRLESTV